MGNKELQPEERYKAKSIIRMDCNKSIYIQSKKESERAFCLGS